MQRTSIDRYLIRGELGSGGMGVVWRAHDPRLRREVAIKEVLLPEHLSREARESAKAWVARESQATARISHPSVVTVHDVLEVDDTPFIVMSLIDGVSLRTRLNEAGPLTAEEALSVARTLLEALSAAHRSGVVHRDIKPANIMLTGGEPTAVLTDFGIASVLESGSVSLTTTGSVLGTAEYLAPERLEHKSAEPPSDLWSLGATLYAAVSGESPFRRDNLATSLSAILASPIPAPPCEGPLRELIEGLLVRDPDQRLTVERALELVGKPSDEGRSVGSDPVGRRPFRKGPVTAVLSSVLAVAVVAAAVFTGPWGNLRGPWTPPESPVEAGEEPTSPAPTHSAGPLPPVEEIGFTTLENDSFTARVPEDWQSTDMTDEALEGNDAAVVRYTLRDPYVEDLTLVLSVYHHDGEPTPGVEGLKRWEEGYAEGGLEDWEFLVLEDLSPGSEVWDVGSLEGLHTNPARAESERWLLEQRKLRTEERAEYFLFANFPADLREVYRPLVEEVAASFGPPGS